MLVSVGIISGMAAGGKGSSGRKENAGRIITDILRLPPGSVVTLTKLISR
jgi:hypothetical protein